LEGVCLIENENMSKEFYDKIKERHDKMKLMAEQFGEDYFLMFGDLILSADPVYTVEEAVEICYNKLVKGL
jgi:hypothetical protein